jgi:hypothetical protein
VASSLQIRLGVQNKMCASCGMIHEHCIDVVLMCLGFGSTVHSEIQRPGYRWVQTCWDGAAMIIPLAMTIHATIRLLISEFVLDVLVPRIDDLERTSWHLTMKFSMILAVACGACALAIPINPAQRESLPNII